MATDVKALIRQWVEAAWNRGDFSQANGLYASSYTLHGAGPGEPVRGPEGISRYIATYRDAMPDLSFTVEDVVAEGDRVAWRFVVRGTHRGELFGVPASGRSITVGGIVISRFVGETWAEDWVSFDALGMLQQMGAIPSAA